MSGGVPPPPVVLSLAEDKSGGAPAPWMRPLIALGSLASRYAAAHAGRQLIIALSVPRRDFAACLIGCGWTIAAQPRPVEDSLDVLRNLATGASARALTDSLILCGPISLDETSRPPRVRVGGKTFHLSRINVVAALEKPADAAHDYRPAPGSLARFTRIESSWDARLVRPPADLALIGTLSWLNTDAHAYVSNPHSALPSTRLADLLLPVGYNEATWSTKVLKAASLAEQLPLDAAIRCAVLDGASAIKYLADIEAPVVICIIDRSVADETAAEIVVQLRNSRGESVGIADDLKWHPPAGIEALAFTVAL